MTDILTQDEIDGLLTEVDREQTHIEKLYVRRLLSLLSKKPNRRGYVIVSRMHDDAQDYQRLLGQVGKQSVEIEELRRTVVYLATALAEAHRGPT